MADIRSEDRGYHTRVFSITSKTIGKRQICIGKKYDEDGRDRYNVYPVENGAVGGKVGYYELESGTKVQDDAGDFDVARFNEPTWTIGKPKQTTEPEVEVEKAPPTPRTNFKIVETVTNGNCFYDTVTRAIAGTPYKKDEQAIKALRKRLGEFITNDDNLMDFVAHYSVLASPDKILMKDDAYYKKYYEYLKEESLDMDEIKEQMEREREKPNFDKSQLDFDVFKSLGPDDESPNQSDSEDALAIELKDYFDGNKNLKTSDDIKTTFLKNINTSGVWANEYVVAQYEKMENMMMVFLEHDSNSDIENLNVHLWSLSVFEPNANTRYILSDYESMRHFKLITQLNPEMSVFTQETLPESINKKLVRSTVTPTVSPTQKKKSAKSAKPKETEPEPDSPGTARDESPDRKTSPTPRDESPVPTAQDESTVRKTDRPTAQESPDQKTPLDESPTREESPARKTTTVREKSPEPVKEPSPAKPSSEFTPPYTADRDGDRLSKLTVIQLKELLKHEYFKDVMKSAATKKNELLDCLLGRESCKTKKKKTGGERFTRRK
jgi:hypothetical protein